MASLAAARGHPAKHQRRLLPLGRRTALIGMLMPLGLPVIFVTPAAWKRALGVRAAKKIGACELAPRG